MKKALNMVVCAAVAMGMALSTASPVFADERAEVSTSIVKDITEIPGQYPHWDGVSPIAQFKYYDPTLKRNIFCLAVDGTEEITIVKIDTDGTVISDDLKLKKTHPIFGTVISDSKGWFYAITGENNNTDDTQKNTVFVTIYSHTGVDMYPNKTIGNNGSSSRPSTHGSDYNTKFPFDSGVSAALGTEGMVLAIHYGREMYNGHQANSVWAVGANTTFTLEGTSWINSHSFAHRVIPFRNPNEKDYPEGFLFVSEGDCNERAFCTYAIKTSSRSVGAYKKGYPFHFWVEKDAAKNNRYGVLNNNFAHLAGIADLGNGTAALVGTAAPALSPAAATQREQLFVQIFDPFADLSKPSAYVTSGVRSGMSGGNGDQQVTDYGVQWLLDYKDSTIENPQVVATDDGKIVILFERGDRKAWTWGWGYNRYDGVYYMVLDSRGNVITPAKLFSKTARLNPSTMPVYINGAVYWAGNTISNNKNVNVNILKLNSNDGNWDEEDGDRDPGYVGDQSPDDEWDNGSGGNTDGSGEDDVVKGDGDNNGGNTGDGGNGDNSDNDGGNTGDGGNGGNSDDNGGNTGNGGNGGNSDDNGGNTGDSVIKGDADGNGTVDVFDAALVLAYISSDDVPIDIKAADVDGDGEITKADAELILRYAVGNRGLF